MLLIRDLRQVATSARAPARLRGPDLTAVEVIEDGFASATAPASRRSGECATCCGSTARLRNSKAARDQIEEKTRHAAKSVGMDSIANELITLVEGLGQADSAAPFVHCLGGTAR